MVDFPKSLGPKGRGNTCPPLTNKFSGPSPRKQETVSRVLCVPPTPPRCSTNHASDRVKYNRNLHIVHAKTPSEEANTAGYGTMKIDPGQIQWKRELSMENIQRLFGSISDSWFFKLLLGAFLSVNDWFFHPRHDVITVVLLFVVFDTITGAMKAYVNHNISSSGFFRCMVKIGVYTILLASGAMLDKVTGVQAIFSSLSIIATFLSTTEAISVMENISALGFKTPKKLLDVLKFSQDLFDEDKTKKS